jgi:hypothetical protein
MKLSFLALVSLLQWVTNTSAQSECQLKAHAYHQKIANCLVDKVGPSSLDFEVRHSSPLAPHQPSIG